MRTAVVLSTLLSASLVAASPVQWPLGLLSKYQVWDNTQTAMDGYDIHEKRLVQFGENESPIWVSEWEKIKFKESGINFMDITDTQDLGFSLFSGDSKRLSAVTYPSPNSTVLVKKVIKSLSTEGPLENLQKFTSFTNRHYRSETGKQSQKWLLSKVDSLTKEYAPDSLLPFVSITEFPHKWGQNSIVAQIKGNSDELIIIGAHQDSTSFLPFLPAPGADDDGSGTVTILEAYRALISSGIRPQKTVEFHWYAAEEGGLLGSRELAQDYERRGALVYAMQHFDMTAWVKKGTQEVVGILTDYTDSSLRKFVTELVDEYLSIPWADTQCGYACSDHASWTQAGYPAMMAIESLFGDSNPNIHGSRDRLDISPEFSFTHMLEFSKLAVALVIELGFPKE
ncbi:peptidase [Sistotremastrum niveocremeum HHB9708]|uniref:Peptide hydrolase n=1 Tax=Sistotremastrum niveocremeum HHB9708 TaxID=1314777 RepID=A0A164Z3A3_9AGAM|nr:peptidase [Sistotremastrum niveocremeum HHB9708]